MKPESGKTGDKEYYSCHYRSQMGNPCMTAEHRFTRYFDADKAKTVLICDRCGKEVLLEEDNAGRSDGVLEVIKSSSSSFRDGRG